MKYVLFILTICFATSLRSQTLTQRETPGPAIWGKISPFFSSPATYEGKYGDYRSPLVFYNGDTVKTAKDWEKRREEILKRWNGMMGEWPDLLTDQELVVQDTIHKENFTQHQVGFYWTPDEMTEGYLLVPDGEGKKPAVVVVFYEPETAVGYLGRKAYFYSIDFAYQLAKRGFVTLSIGTTEASKRGEYSLYYPSIDSATVQPLSMLAYAAANAWNVLTKVKDVDSIRIGIVGHSFGGKWAMFASCLYEKFACAAWCDPGIVFDETDRAINYWDPWYLGYYPPPWTNTRELSNKGLYPKLVADGYDLTELHALMAPRPFHVSGGKEDPPKRWTALSHSIAVNNLLGFKNRVAMTNLRPVHATTRESNEQLYLFFQYFLQYGGLQTH